MPDNVRWTRQQQRQLEDLLKSLWPEIAITKPDAKKLAEICEKRLGYKVGQHSVISAAKIIGLTVRLPVSETKLRQEAQEWKIKALAGYLVWIAKELGQTVPDEVQEIAKIT